MKPFFIAAILVCAMLFNTTSTMFAAPAKDKETIYQVALLQSLTLGYFNGTVTVKELKTHGDTGIGTFEGLDGEMIVLDGIVYRANQNCRINVVNDRVLVPFSNVTFFEKDFSVKLHNVLDKNELESTLNTHVNKHGTNDFYMVKIPGVFNEIHVRSEEGQVEPYPTLVEALTATQKECTFQNIKGTLVGLYCPAFMSSLNSTGWHFHFVSDDKKVGGHVLGLHLESGDAQFDKTPAFQMILPETGKFNSLNFDTDLKEDIRKAEQDSVRR